MELHVVGRLDVDTTGLVLLTDDGSWTYKIITPNAQCEKVYRVSLRDEIHDEAIHRIEQGLKLQGIDKPTLPAKITVLESHVVLLTITQGHFHQVKRMFRAVGNKVRELHREKIGAVSLDLAVGQWRYLTDDEVRSFG
jgi:16S rRNA pseudouridine516 synthase